MTKQTSEWQTEELSKVFLEGVRGAIPGAQLQFAVIGKIVQLWCANPKSLLDLGCGDGILGGFLLSLFPGAHCHFVDFSEPMLAAARHKLAEMGNATISRGDFSTSQWLECIRGHEPFNVVISGFSIHHQPDARKRALYAEIFDLLSPGGVFLNLEHVSSATPAGQDLFDDFFVDHLHEFHHRAGSASTRPAIANAYYNRPDKKENILAPVELQCQWLREIGFQDVDCFFKVFELALLGGRRHSSPEEDRGSAR